MRQLLPIVLFTFFICQAEARHLTCLPCGDPDVGCLSIFAVAKQFTDFKEASVSVEQVLDIMKEQGKSIDERISYLEMQLKTKGEKQ